ncbi:MAG: hypothetical protein KKE44_24195 [Proteobacteria bacterium]|nr:hypothetical protein [Pseudomonadota bacterium]MBU1585834.1 hypothetical protein [Pseudomonadota bacterium]
MKKVILTALIWLLICPGQLICKTLTGSDPERPIRVLLVGNSYTYFNELPTVIKNIGLSQKPKIFMAVSMAAYGGNSLSRTVMYCKSGSCSLYEYLNREPYDFVILQDHSKAPVNNRNEMGYSAVYLHKVIKQYQAKTLFFMTWAPKNNPGLINEISQAYSTAGKNCDSGVAPVGLAWDRTIKETDIDLYNIDGSHPNMAGTYLTACVLFTTITEKSCAGLDFNSSIQVSKKVRTALEKISWSTYTNYRHP